MQEKNWFLEATLFDEIPSSVLKCNKIIYANVNVASERFLFARRELCYFVQKKSTASTNLYQQRMSIVYRIS